jgi:hypothetical protein
MQISTSSATVVQLCRGLCNKGPSEVHRGLSLRRLRGRRWLCQGLRLLRLAGGIEVRHLSLPGIAVKVIALFCFGALLADGARNELTISVMQFHVPRSCYDDIVTCFVRHISEIVFPPQSIRNFVGNRFVKAYVPSNRH